jgi:hypothetical protein
LIVRVDDVGLFDRRLQAVQADFDVFTPGPHDVAGHGCDAGRAVDFERLPAAGDGGREDQVGQADRVIGMQVGDEGARELIHANAGLRGPPHHAGTAIDNVHVRSGDDCDGGSAVFRLRIGGSGAEQNDAGVLGRRGRQQQDGKQKELHEAGPISPFARRNVNGGAARLQQPRSYRRRASCA